MAVKQKPANTLKNTHRYGWWRPAWNLSFEGWIEGRVGNVAVQQIPNLVSTRRFGRGWECSARAKPTCDYVIGCASAHRTRVPNAHGGP